MFVSNMRSCQECGNTIPYGKLCFECYCKFDVEDAEEKLAAMLVRSKFRPGAYPVGNFSPWLGHTCGHCWPFDCRCY